VAPVHSGGATVSILAFHLKDYTAVRDSVAGQPKGAAKATRTVPNALPPSPE
jgi:hypothetical protein